MTIERAIKKAIQEGWWPIENIEERSTEVNHDQIFRNIFDMQANESYFYARSLGMSLLDPLFWQSLGKALGWSEEYQGVYLGNASVVLKGEWHHQMHLFVDHLAEGKDAESFFAAF